MRHKVIVTVYAVCCFFALIARLIQMMYFTEPLTGFFKSGSTVYGWIAGFVIALSVLVACYAGFSSRRVPKNMPEISKPLAVCSLITGVGIVASPVMESIMFGSSVIKTVSILLSLLAAVFFVVFGVCAIGKAQAPGYVSLFTLPFFMFRIIESFIGNTGMANITENIIELIMMCFVLIFFLYFSKLQNKVYAISSAHKCLPLALAGSILCFVSTAPLMLMYLIGKSGILHQMSFPDFGYLLTGLFIAWYSFALFSKNNLPKKERETKDMRIEGMSYNELNAGYYNEID